jgi:adenylosuccinate lyase
MSVRSAGEIFGEAETLALYLGIEVALAHAQAEVGVIPEDAARAKSSGVRHWTPSTFRACGRRLSAPATL